MLFRNLNTGDEMNVSNLKMVDGRIFFSVRGAGCGKKFFNRNTCLVHDEDAPNGTFLKCADGWELVSEPRRRRASVTHASVQPTPVAEPTVEPIAEPISSEPTIVQQPVATQQPAYTSAQTAQGYDILGGLFSVVEQRVTENVKQMIQPVLKHAAVKIQLIDTAGISRTIEGVVHEKFGVVAQLVSDKKPVYLYGASGSGKNVLAEQVAKGLGMAYYYQSCVKDDFVLTGTPTATGEYCPSEFYKAFTKGGIFVLDEADSIPQDVSLVLNQAIANGEFTFPVVGTCKAHENFRIIACGNTGMGGASIEYNGRYAQDGAFKNRFAFVRIDYDKRIEEALSDGDQEILDFIYQLRKSAEDRHITLICGYRQILGMAQYRKIFKPEDVLDMFVTQGMRIDELRILCNGVSTDNKYGKALSKMAKKAA